MLRTSLDVTIKGRTVLRTLDAGGPAPLYVSRPLLNADELVRWARAAGLEAVVPAEEMHVTVAYSKTPVDWFKTGQEYGEVGVSAGGPRRVEVFGDPGRDEVVVLRFQSPYLQRRWEEFRAAGCSWKWSEYAPHVTVAKGAGRADVSKLPAYAGPLRFGPEVYAPIKDSSQ